jgi:hypothetical protein
MDSCNAAFADGGRDEVAKILLEVTKKVNSGFSHDVCLDTNGAKVGEWDFEESEIEDDGTPKKIHDGDELKAFAVKSGVGEREKGFASFVEALEEQFSRYPVYDDDLDVDVAKERAKEIDAQEEEG